MVGGYLSSCAFGTELECLLPIKCYRFRLRYRDKYYQWIGDKRLFCERLQARRHLLAGVGTVDPS